MRWCLYMAVYLWSGMASAHPHIFIETGLQILFDSQGRVSAVRVIWSYDEFYSLLQLEELELDPDGDGVLDDAEQAKLAGFDTQWVEGYEGDLYVTANGQKLELGAPIEPGGKLEDGRIVTWHTRPLVQRQDPNAAAIEFKVYDPTFYTAYSVDLGATTKGRDGCEVMIEPANLAEAYDRLEEMLNGPSDGSDPEAGFPAVGEQFADTLTIECAPRS